MMAQLEIHFQTLKLRKIMTDNGYISFHKWYFISGRGLKNGENFEMLYKLAEKMNAAGKLSDCFTCKSLFVLFQCGIAVYCLIRIQATCMLSTILFFFFFYSRSGCLKSSC